MNEINDFLYIGTQNIYLIGMMGSWKSTVGKMLADELQMILVDIDKIIESATKKSISEIFEEYGEKRFRELESLYFSKYAIYDNQVFATGGGIILDEENRKIITEQGKTILLRANPTTLSHRIRNLTSRPLLSKTNDIEIQLKKIWQERRQLYESTAHYIIDTDDMTPKDVAEEIILQLTKSNENN